jgi:hypothetical protein
MRIALSSSSTSLSVTWRGTSLFVVGAFRAGAARPRPAVFVRGWARGAATTSVGLGEGARLTGTIGSEIRRGRAGGDGGSSAPGSGGG